MLPVGVLGSFARNEPSWRWALALAGLLALRAWGLSQDPLLVSWSGVYLTDEGWYSKAARNIVMWGQSDAHIDFVPLTHTFGYSALSTLVFHVSGVRLLGLRLLSLVLSWIGVGVLAHAVHTRLGPRYGRMCALALAANLLLVSLSRMALPDALAFALCCITVGVYLKSPQKPALQWLCACLAALLSVVKLSFFPVTLWIAVLLGLARRQEPRRRAWGGVALFVTPLFLVALSYGQIYLQLPAAWAMFSRLNLQGRMIHSPLELVPNLVSGLASDLWSTGVLGLVGFMALYGRHQARRFWGSRPCQALLLLLTLTASSRSWIQYHPPRYGLITALCTVLLSVLLCQHCMQVLRLRPVVVIRRWLFALALGQLPQLYALAQHGWSQDSLRTSSDRVHAAIERHVDHPMVLYGTGSASLVALHHPQLRSVDIADGVADLCEILDHYGPGFVLLDRRKELEYGLLDRLQRCAPGMQLSALLSTQVLNNYYGQGDWTLYKLSGHQAR